jgi:hypothetical protein
LALAGVVIAILLQREELALQREELAATRVELSRAAEAQEQSREALQQTIYANSFKSAFDILQDPRVLDARKRLFDAARAYPFEQWTTVDLEAAEIVSNAYNVVGLMVRHGLLPAAYIAEYGAWGESLMECWTILQPFAVDIRQRRGSDDYLRNFEYLAEAAMSMNVKEQ